MPRLRKLLERDIQRMVNRIVRQFDPERIILFGSYARRDAGPDADVDLLVVMRISGCKRRKQLEIRRALRDFQIPKDIIITTPEDFAWRKDIPGTIEPTRSRTCPSCVSPLASPSWTRHRSTTPRCIERNWPPALKESGAWPLASLRQSFLNGSLTRLVDPDTILRGKVVEFVGRGDFGLASGRKPHGSYERVWFEELVATEEVAFEAGVFLLRKVAAEALGGGVPAKPAPVPEPGPGPVSTPEPAALPVSEPAPGAYTKTIRLVGIVPPEVWNRLGTKILPKLRSGSDLRVGVEFSVTVKAENAGNLTTELRQILQELGLAESVRVE